MRRQKPTYRARCTHPGCNETSHYEFERKSDLKEVLPKLKEWKCSRHSRPDEVMSPNEWNKEVAVVSEMVMRTDGVTPLGLFWNFGKYRNGFISGPGFKAWAKDFPVGTVLTVTARIKLP